MMKFEFENLAGYEVSNEDYNNIIEPMYMATNLTKSEFVKTVDRKRFELKKEKTVGQIELENSLNEELETIKEDIKYYTDRIETVKSFIPTETEKNCINEWKELIKRYKEQIKILISIGENFERKRKKSGTFFRVYP